MWTAWCQSSNGSKSDVDILFRLHNYVYVDGSRLNGGTDLLRNPSTWNVDVWCIVIVVPYCMLVCMCA